MMENKTKTYRLIISIVLLIIIIISGTYAWNLWSSDEETKIVTNIVTDYGTAKVNYNGGSNILGVRLEPTYTKEEGIVKTVKVSSDINVGNRITMDLFLDIVSLDDGLKDPSFKYEIHRNGTKVKEGNFSEDYLTSNLEDCTINSTDESTVSHIVLLENDIVSTTESVYTLYLWIDKNMTNPTEMQSKEFEFKLHAAGVGTELAKSKVMTEYLSELYYNSIDSEATVNNVTYNLASGEGLMNDRLGMQNNWEVFYQLTGQEQPFTTQQGCYEYFDCNAFVEAGEFESLDECEEALSLVFEQEFSQFGFDNVDEFCGVTDINAGNIRYYGATPNNYIDIGDATKKDITVGNWVAIYKSLGASEEIINQMIPNQDACYEMFDCEAKVEAGDYDDLDTCETERDSELASLGVSSVDEMCGVETVLAGTPILYRIVGLFKDVKLEDGTTQDLIKIVRDESIGTYSFDTSASDDNNGYGYSDWTQSDLMKLLNPGFDSNTDFDSTSASIIVNNSLYWNSETGIGICYAGQNNATTSCDFSNEGLSSSTIGNIEKVTWKMQLGATEFYPNQVYYAENNYPFPSAFSDRSTTWNGNVGLLSISDIGYASNLSVCNQLLNAYSDTNCLSTNWITNFGTEIVVTQWLFNIADNSKLFVVGSGLINNQMSLMFLSDYAYNPYGVRPSFYISKDLSIISGTGMESDPYVVG